MQCYQKTSSCYLTETLIRLQNMSQQATLAGSFSCGFAFLLLWLSSIPNSRYLLFSEICPVVLPFRLSSHSSHWKRRVFHFFAPVFAKVRNFPSPFHNSKWKIKKNFNFSICFSSLPQKFFSFIWTLFFITKWFSFICFRFILNERKFIYAGTDSMLQSFQPLWQLNWMLNFSVILISMSCGEE